MYTCQSVSSIYLKYVIGYPSISSNTKIDAGQNDPQPSKEVFV